MDQPTRTDAAADWRGNARSPVGPATAFYGLGDAVCHFMMENRYSSIPIQSFFDLSLSIANSPSSRSDSAAGAAAVLRGCLCLLMCAALLFAAIHARAQESAPQPKPDSAAQAASGSIRGFVTSTDGAVYQGARVVLEQNGAPAETQWTDGNGAFSFTNLLAGAYRLTASAEGFTAQTEDGSLHAGEALAAGTIVLPVAAASSEVRVSAESQVELAEEQLIVEEKQRVLGVFPNFYVSYDRNTAPLTARQKYRLAWRTTIDPISWMMAGTIAGIEQGSNTFAGYGQGWQGYGKRFGANFADMSTNVLIGNAILPALFRQDPRYFYKGTGTVRLRALYAVASAFICKGDNDRWQPSYSTWLGGLASGGLSNLYYPASSRSGVQVTFENALIGTAGGAVQNLFQEFLVRRLTPHLPGRAAR
jgi:hypothetical protein